MTPLDRVRTRYAQAWTGGDSLSPSATDALPPSEVDRLSFALLLSGLLDPADLRRARWFSRDASESVLLLLLQARLRRGHGSALASDLAADLESICSTPFPALAASALAPLPEALAADSAVLSTLLAEAVARTAAEPEALVRADTRQEGIILSFARSHEAQSLLASRLLDRIRHHATEANADPAIVDGICDRSPSLHEGQKDAVLHALSYRTVVVSGGPGTGKTTVVARILEALSRVEIGFERESVALCAPTGRAKARLQESIGTALPAWGALSAFTLHSLLGPRPDGSFRHDAGNPLPYAMVVVDEASMIDLAIFAALLDALAPDTRLLLLGDPDQLPSVEAGAVFGDLVEILGQGESFPGIHHARLTFTHRNSGDIRRLAEEVNRGETESVFSRESLDPGAGAAFRETLRTDPAGTVRWIGGDLEDALQLWWDLHGTGSSDLALKAEADAIGRARILCATHQGASGRERINDLGDRRLQAQAQQEGRAPSTGRPVILTRNLPSHDLWNGDLGVLVQTEGVQHVLFARGEGFRTLPPERLEGLEPAWAITIHKSQGSEFDHVFLVLPDDDSPLLTRQILYTGLTRARKTLWIWGRKDLWALGCMRRELRSSRLRELLGS